VFVPRAWPWPKIREYLIAIFESVHLPLRFSILEFLESGAEWSYLLANFASHREIAGHARYLLQIILLQKWPCTSVLIRKLNKTSGICSDSDWRCQGFPYVVFSEFMRLRD
jgi:hypothetical protein